MTGKELNKILEKHKKWLNGEKGGEKANLISENLGGANLIFADLRKADLSDADLSYANLSRANLSEARLTLADLRNANLSETNLSDANLSETNLSEACLIHADLSGTHFRWADLSHVDLSGADLRCADIRAANLSKAILNGANLDCVKYDENTAFFAMSCPEEGEFIGFKKAQGKIVKLKIPARAKRSSATSRKCRCSEAKVLSITNLDGTPYEKDSVSSDKDGNFVYTVGKTVKVKAFDENRWNECSTGIHFFITRDEAVQY